ncbi:MAG: hypothetical protein PHC48_02260 [Prevotella sp.]|nr:hypothetical protein [Prevotella sp.]MDD4533279.1 hypothetical protein [Prevotella sp.]MDT3388722.1 hypothetical protein [Bacteroidota bacterium]
MKKKLAFLVTFLVLTTICYAQQSTSFGNWGWLLGEWIGEGSGKPGQGGGTFSFSYDLDKNIIVRKSHSEYPAAGNKPQIIHDDLMIVYPDANDKTTKAMYFDNEGHVINYTVSLTDKLITLTSLPSSNAPIFRLTYELLDQEIVNTKFEMSRDGVNFMTYVEGKSKKMK